MTDATKAYAYNAEHFKRLRLVASTAGIVCALMLLIKGRFAVGTILIIVFLEPMLEYVPFTKEKHQDLIQHTWLVALVFSLISMTWLL